MINNILCRGDLCKLNKRAQNISGVAKIQLENFEKRNIEEFIVLKTIKDNKVLAVNASEVYVNNYTELKDGEYTLYVNCITFWKIDKRILIKDECVLENPKEIVSSIYDVHKKIVEYLKEKEAKRIESLKKSGGRKKKFDHNRINSYSNTSWSIRHPFRGF